MTPATLLLTVLLLTLLAWAWNILSFQRRQRAIVDQALHASSLRLYHLSGDERWLE